MIIAIDTSHNKTYSCVVFGFKNDIMETYKKISRVLAKHGKTGTIHWQKISSKIRKNAKNEIYDTINNSPATFYIFKHHKPLLIEKEKYYLNSVPNFIASYLERRLRGKYGTVLIEVDDDYLVSNVKNSSLKFTETLLVQLCFRLIGTFAKVRRNGKLRATIKHTNGNVMDFICYITTRSLSEGVQLSDIVLGYYLYDSRGMEKIDLAELR